MILEIFEKNSYLDVFSFFSASLRQPRWYKWKIWDFFVVRHIKPFSITKLALAWHWKYYFTNLRYAPWAKAAKNAQIKIIFKDSGWPKSKLLTFHGMRIYSELSNSLAKLWWFKLKSHSWFIAVCWSVTVSFWSYFCT